MNERKVYIAVAAHFGAQDMLFVQALCQLLVARPCPMQIGWNCDPCIDRARNILVANFLESDCTHILFIDGDIGFSPGDVTRIISHDEPVVGGMYPLKRDGKQIEWCGNGILGRVAALRDDGLQEVRYIGTGFMCVARAAFGKIIATDGAAIQYEADNEPHRREWAFFREGVCKTDDARIRFLTEDWFFCQRWLDLGGRVFGDTRVLLRHAGRTVWPLPLQENNPFNPPA
jgi:hypothetical protein